MLRVLIVELYVPVGHIFKEKCTKILIPVRQANMAEKVAIFDRCRQGSLANWVMFLQHIHNILKKLN